IEDGQIVMQRKIMNGRGICKINGETVPVSVLKEVSGLLIDIHGQHEHQSLLYKKKHREILDSYCAEAFAGLPARILEYYGQYIKKRAELADAEKTTDNKEKEAALAQFEVDEIREADLIIGEDEQLEADYRRMKNAKKIAEAISFVHQYTGYDSENGAGAAIGRALGFLRNAAGYDEEMAQLLAQITDIDNLLNDFNRSVAVYEEKMTFGEEEFIRTEERLNTINHMKSKYGDTIEKIMAYCEEQEKSLEKYQNYDEYIGNLRRETEHLKEQLTDVCEKVSKIRSREAVILAQEIKDALIDLNFSDARFEIRVEKSEEHMSVNGFDDVEFLISTNPGERVKPLIQVASGGELSRIMLALKAVLAGKDQIGTLIFDEIDTGISGRTAQKVSEKLAYLSGKHQVICVTHLPQIAAMADVHFEIAKSVNNGRTVTEVKKLDEEASVKELARMLGGVKITEAVFENAKEMKKLAGKIKKKFL
ncbi:MAG TPA: DNA repair protein RecN, partial [Lachnospiraceae bacterium]|nr:DNA repair protein RecN [Lachnospiraceae bacterium]